MAAQKQQFSHDKRQRYDPFGDALTSVGTGASAFGFAGEQTDATGLEYLRARYYAATQGRFIAKDLWEGDAQRPQSTNRWSHVEGNPVNRTDPTGHGWCLPLVGLTWGDLPENAFGLTVGQAIDFCRFWYSKDGPLTVLGGHWVDYCDSVSHRDWSEPQTVAQLSFDWLCGWGEKRVYLHATNRLTQEFARSRNMDGVRRMFYARGNLRHDDPDFEVQFGVPDFIFSLPDVRGEIPIPISQFVGSFDRQAFALPFERVGFQIDNRTDRSSGTHFVGRFEPQYPDTLEQLVDKGAISRNDPLIWSLKNYRVVSILKQKTREQLTGDEGGGSMRQSFVWSERNLECTLQRIPWPFYDNLLDVRVWPDFRNYAWQNPDLDL